MIIPVILSGGSGTRLWPLSTPDRPKQFLPLIGEESLFQETLRRIDNRSDYGSPIVVGSAAHERHCIQELSGSPDASLILEPVPRNTAVAIVMAAALVAKTRPDDILLVMPSDHRIGDEPAFHRAVRVGAEVAASGKLVTFGITPTGPETGYGYLQAGPAISENDSAFAVARFKEKPDAQSAEQMLSAGGHYWNGGIFLFRADSFLDACRTFAPDVFECGVNALSSGSMEGRIVRPFANSLEHCPNISVDYAVMERSDTIAMVPLDAGWSDVGSWDSLADLATETSMGAHALDSANCYVRTDGMKVALLGVEDLIVVGQGDQVVVMKRGRSQDIKRLAALVAND